MKTIPTASAFEFGDRLSAAASSQFLSKPHRFDASERIEGWEECTAKEFPKTEKGFPRTA